MLLTLVVSCATINGMSYLASALKKHNLKRVEFAAKAGVNKGTVTRWAQDKVPAERILDLETKTGISREDLRPDLFDKETAA